MTPTTPPRTPRPSKHRHLLQQDPQRHILRRQPTQPQFQAPHRPPQSVPPAPHPQLSGPELRQRASRQPQPDLQQHPQPSNTPRPPRLSHPANAVSTPAGPAQAAHVADGSYAADVVLRSSAGGVLSTPLRAPSVSPCATSTLHSTSHHPPPAST
ncbi:hypothetical protein EJ06DRAFT_528002 [Trichodelitschia bisporula]|uniref:Uncharacterized protein n=1 Tax=Trichodelitschia bisporula TaxID=703511 RepID=A0A6G1I4N8_9PEZI|nr:hypothetical protein EJ06DRAFT_528002 [Trichodelitschia bisporula]